MLRMIQESIRYNKENKMNKKSFFNISILAFAFALAFLFAAPNGAMAAGENQGLSTNLFGLDNAHNGSGLDARDRDVAPAPRFQSYGLQGDWAGAQM